MTAAQLLAPDNQDDFEDTIPLLGEPVEVPADSTHLVMYPSLRQRLGTLEQMVKLGKAIAIVIGDYGSGKTLLARYCHTDLWSDRKQIHLSAQAGLSMTQLCRELTRTLGIRGKGNINFARISRLLINNHAHLHHVLVIDDANNLTRDVLLALLRLKQALVEKKADFNIVLFAEPEIKHALVHESLEDYSDGWAGYIYLPRLSAQDVADYVRDRTTMVANGRAAPDEEDVAALHEQSGGLPLRINELLDRLWLEDKPAQKKKGRRPRLLWLGIAGGMLLTLLAVAFMWPRAVDQILTRLF